MTGDIRCVWPLEAQLGEGPVWDSRESCLWFVDIKQGRLHRYDPAADERTTYDIGGTPSFALPAVEGGLLIGRKDELLHWRDGCIRIVAKVAMGSGDRLNDATVDASGRVWFGSMDDGETDPTGRVGSFHRGLLRDEGLTAVITNGPAISRDGRWLFHVDTLERTIWRLPIDHAGTCGAGQPFVRIEPGDGAPDGVTIDAEDHLWVGLWGGWRARRYSSDGAIVSEIPLPCANVTKIAFGGPGLHTAYITTARAGLSPGEAENQPLSGGLFAVDAGVSGRAMPLARLAPEPPETIP